MHADRIYVLERGRIAETGQHDRLIEAKGLYYAMWRQQVGERRVPAPAAGPTGADVARGGVPAGAR
jgi:ATP-binding cassette subfamily B protein